MNNTEAFLFVVPAEREMHGEAEPRSTAFVGRLEGQSDTDLIIVTESWAIIEQGLATPDLAMNN